MKAYKKNETNRYYKKEVVKKRKLRNLYRETSSYFCSGACYSDYLRRSVPAPDAYLQRYWRGQRSKQLKKYCNRELRRKLNNVEYECANGNSYRRHTEFWWQYD